MNEGSQDMKMTGLILAQSALVGVAVGVYDAGIWLPAGSAGDSWGKWNDVFHGCIGLYRQ